MMRDWVQMHNLLKNLLIGNEAWWANSEWYPSLRKDSDPGGWGRNLCVDTDNLWNNVFEEVDPWQMLKV